MIRKFHNFKITFSLFSSTHLPKGKMHQTEQYQKRTYEMNVGIWLAGHQEAQLHSLSEKY